MTKIATFVAPTMDSLPKTDTALDKAFTSIKSRGVKLQMDVHRAACGVLYRMNELGNNDVRIVGKLMDALPASYRTNALRDWFTAFAPVAWDKNKPVFAATKSDKAIDLAQAIREPFWLFSPEAAYVPIDVDKSIEALIKKLVADQTKAGTHHGKAIATLESLRGELKAAPAAAPAAPANDAGLITADVLAG